MSPPAMPLHEIRVSVWPRGASALEHLAAAIDRFCARAPDIRIHLYAMDPMNVWPEILQVALHGQGPDVSEVGSTWVHSLIAMNGLRCFEPEEIAGLGGEAAYAPPLWKASISPTDRDVYAIPWVCETRLVYYRQDLLRAVGVDEQSAFDTPGHFLETLERLSRRGVQVPLIVPAQDRWLFLSFVSSWIWGAGGDLVNAAGNRAIFDQPEALAGLRDFFRLARYTRPGDRDLDQVEVSRQFLQGSGAVTLSGLWLFGMVQDNPLARLPLVTADLGVALPPGSPYVGGTHLVIWKHTERVKLALKLIQHLSGEEAPSLFKLGVLPARIDALAANREAKDPMYQTMIKGIQTGRTYSSTPLWGVVEERLSRALLKAWQEYCQNCEQDLDALLKRHLLPVAREINMTFRR